MTEEPWERQKQALGGFIRAQRELARLSIRQLSDLASVSNAYLSQIERGLHEPSIRIIKSVAEALDIPAETLLERVGLLEDDAGDSPSVTTEQAIVADSLLTDDEKQALLTVYRSYVAGRE